MKEDTRTPLWNGSCGDDDHDGGSFLMKRLLAKRTIMLTGGVDSKLAQRVLNQLMILEADDAEAPITIIMNSPGGSVSDGLSIYDMIKFVQPRVKIVCAGLCASIATIILLAADKGDRLSLANTRFMIHQPLIPMSVFGPASDLEITANEILKTREKINRVLADGTGQPYEKVEEDTQRDYWMTADEAIEYGLADAIVLKRSDIDGK